MEGEKRQESTGRSRSRSTGRSSSNSNDSAVGGTSLSLLSTNNNNSRRPPNTARPSSSVNSVTSGRGANYNSLPDTSSGEDDEEEDLAQKSATILTGNGIAGPEEDTISVQQLEHPAEGSEEIGVPDPSLSLPFLVPIYAFISFPREDHHHHPANPAMEEGGDENRTETRMATIGCCMDDDELSSGTSIPAERMVMEAVSIKGGNL